MFVFPVSPARGDQFAFVFLAWHSIGHLVVAEIWPFVLAGSIHAVLQPVYVVVQVEAPGQEVAARSRHETQAYLHVIVPPPVHTPRGIWAGAGSLSLTGSDPAPPLIVL